MEQPRVEAKKDGIIKTLAIAGFVGLIIIIAWVSIQLVQVLPSAFTSLASLADSVYNYQPAQLQVSSNKQSVAHNETFTLSWTNLDRTGSYAFSYACVEGLSLDMRDTLGSIKSLSCDTNYNLGTVTSADFIALSERTRFVDLAYTIDFIPSGRTEPNGSADGTLSVVNPGISLTDSTTATSTATTTVAGTATSTTATTTPVVTTPKPATTTLATPKPEVKPATTTKPAPTRPTPPVTVQRPVYGLPVSNPNGTTDLLVTFGGTGTIDGNAFRSTGVIDNDTTGAIQFVVKNIGTKTSNEWTYVAKLPNGETFTSRVQAPLKPNERAVLTIGFPTDGMTGAKRYNISASVTNDINNKNNSFESVVAITD